MRIILSPIRLVNSPPDFRKVYTVFTINICEMFILDLHCSFDDIFEDSDGEDFYSDAIVFTFGLFTWRKSLLIMSPLS